MASELTRKVSRRRFIGTVAATTGALLLAGCGSQPASAPEPTKATTGSGPSEPAQATQPAPKGRVTVVWWRSLTAVIAEALDTMAKEFNESQDAVTVQVEYQGTYDECSDKFAAAVAANATPDMIMFSELHYGAFARNDNLLALDDLISGARGVDLDDYYPLVKRGYVLGKAYQMPLMVSTPIFYYNVDALTEAGFDGPPKTWDELFDVYMPKTTILEGSARRNGFTFYNADFWWQQSYVWSYGGKLSDEQFNVYLDSPQVIDYLTRMQKAIKTGEAYIPTAADGDANAYFGSGRAAMMIHSTGNISRLDDVVEGRFAADVSYLPEGPEGRAVPTGGGGVSIVAGKSAEKSEACWEFIRYTQEPKQVAYFCGMTGYIPYTKAAAAEMAPLMEEDPRRKVAVDQLAWSRGNSEVLAINRSKVPVVEQTTHVIQSDTDPKTAMEKLQVQVTDILIDEGLQK
jgi:sn-glycerol 3-phosphate transport system substrate-binding protein